MTTTPDVLSLRLYGYEDSRRWDWGDAIDLRAIPHADLLAPMIAALGVRVIREEAD